MFLDQINESSLDFDFEDHFNDALIEGAVEMESAYYELVSESCQIKFQQVSESTSIEALNEGVIDSIKNFFKKLWNAITKLFSGGSDGSGSAKEEIKKNTELLDYMTKNKEAIDAHAAEKSRVVGNVALLHRLKRSVGSLLHSLCASVAVVFIIKIGANTGSKIRHRNG